MSSIISPSTALADENSCSRTASLRRSEHRGRKIMQRQFYTPQLPRLASKPCKLTLPFPYRSILRVGKGPLHSTQIGLQIKTVQMYGSLALGLFAASDLQIYKVYRLEADPDSLSTPMGPYSLALEVALSASYVLSPKPKGLKRRKDVALLHLLGNSGPGKQLYWKARPGEPLLANKVIRR